MRKGREPGAGSPRLRFGLRPRLLAALVLVAVATLGSAALTLLAPLESQLQHNSLKLTDAVVTGAKTQLGYIPLGPDGLANRTQIHRAADKIADSNALAGVVVWTTTLHHIADTDPRRYRSVSAALARRAFHARAGRLVHSISDGVLAVAARYRGQGTTPTNGSYYVVEVFSTVDYVGTAYAVVRSAFLKAALVGLAVALLLGTALSARLLRRLRLLQDASRSLDERDLGTLVVPEDTVSDEIGELARGFATMHARLRQQEGARRAFVATASHELRTPLTSLDGMLELIADDLEREPIDLADARERVARAREQSRRLGGLASDLLDLSRLDATLELRSEPVALAETARAVAAEFDTRARGRGVSIVLEEQGGQSWAQADPGSVARIVRILLDNALRVAPPGSAIEVAIGAAGAPTIEVSDSGPGVPADERQLIFERFQRGRGRGDEGGFGLGLAIGSELAARMHGSLVLLEDGGAGATFRLTLPVAS